MKEAAFKVHTFGCKVNTYDSGLLQKQLVAEGFQHDLKNPRIHILNSCAVTQEATREVLRQARKIKSKDAGAKVILTGCASQVDGILVDQEPALDFIVANSHKGDMAKYLSQYLEGALTQRVLRGNIFRNETLGEGGGIEETHTRSFLKIQDGCNSFCTFCIIPFARGKSRSLPVPMLLSRINQLIDQGVQEVVLTGVHIGDYEDQDTPGGPFQLPGLVKQVLQKTSIQRLRLTSLEPIELSEDLLKLYDDPRLCSHFHMSIQSAQSDILKKMRRNYTAQDVETSLKWISQEVPQAFVGMDVIVGFPGETHQDFEETYERLKNLPWTSIHVFPYSERRGTRAETFENSVPVFERKERARKLRALSRDRFNDHALRQVGLIKKVLPLEGRSEDLDRGVSRDYWDVRWNSQRSKSVNFSPEPDNGMPPKRDSQTRGPSREILMKIVGVEKGTDVGGKGYLVGQVVS